LSKRSAGRAASPICILNDGAYGAQIHRLRADGIDDSGSVFDHTDFSAIVKSLACAAPTSLRHEALLPANCAVFATQGACSPSRRSMLMLGSDWRADD
jgi:hypothetical protein